jgi:hypothetical protein
VEIRLVQRLADASTAGIGADPPPPAKAYVAPDGRTNPFERVRGLCSEDRGADAFCQCVEDATGRRQSPFERQCADLDLMEPGVLEHLTHFRGIAESEECRTGGQAHIHLDNV